MFLRLLCPTTIERDLCLNGQEAKRRPNVIVRKGFMGSARGIRRNVGTLLLKDRLVRPIMRLRSNLRKRAGSTLYALRRPASAIRLILISGIPRRRIKERLGNGLPGVPKNAFVLLPCVLRLLANCRRRIVVASGLNEVTRRAACTKDVFHRIRFVLYIAVSKMNGFYFTAVNGVRAIAFQRENCFPRSVILIFRER